MNLEVFKNYLESKGDKNDLEKAALSSLKDEKFINLYDAFTYFETTPSLVDVVNNPLAYDTPDNKRHYVHLLVELTNTYKSFLYDTKGKYTKIKVDQQEILDSIIRINADIENIEKVSKAISGEKVLSVYAEEFKIRADDYQGIAKRWLRWLIVSYCLVAIIVVLTFAINVTDTKRIYVLIADEFKPHMQIALLTLKALILLGAVQLSRFFSRNYNANMHLYHQTLHKHDVLRALQGVYLTISVENKEAKDELIKTGAIIAFQNIESGYITVKEGAGDADAYTSSLLASILKK